LLFSFAGFFKIGGYVSLHDSNFNVEGESTKISSDTKSNSFFLKSVENVTKSIIAPAFELKL
jgi:hypothetical protein